MNRVPGERNALERMAWLDELGGALDEAERLLPGLTLKPDDSHVLRELSLKIAAARHAAQALALGVDDNASAVMGPKRRKSRPWQAGRDR
ncbi:MAG: hypothetical protein ABIO80_03500 [Sphingomicrobium sp.]